MPVQDTTGSMVQFVVMMVALFAIMYFMVIRPQKKEKLTREMLAGLIVGDKIITIGGIIGKIVQIKDENLVIETGSASEKSNIKIARWAVKEVLKPAQE